MYDLSKVTVDQIKAYLTRHYAWNEHDFKQRADYSREKWINLLTEDFDVEEFMEFMKRRNNPKECDHEDFDTYFGKCPDCGVTFQGLLDIHEKECVPAGDFELDKDGTCSKCGTCITYCKDVIAEEEQ